MILSRCFKLLRPRRLSRFVPRSRLRQVLLALLVLCVCWHLWALAQIVWWRYHNPSMTSFMSEQQQRLQERNPRARLRQQWVSYEHISRNLKRALIAAEDSRFVDHQGFDWDGIQTAWDKNLRQGRIVAGGSTISQQLAKNLFLSEQRTPWRKAREALLTLMLESVLDKRRILEIYLNVIEWGQGLFGAEAAARYYYGVSVAQLSAPQAARLAAMVTNPRYYQQRPYDWRLQRKAGIIQRRMYQVQVPR